MDDTQAFERRTFHELTVAALLGVIAGTSEEAEAQPREMQAKPVDLGNPLLREPNICRGLNACKGKGRGSATGGQNQCAGTSVCATVAAHVCSGNNNCRGQGACDQGDPAKYQVGYPGENTCKGKGACGVPIPREKDHVWQQARRRLEALIKDAGGNAGAAPPRR